MVKRLHDSGDLPTDAKRARRGGVVKWVNARLLRRGERRRREAKSHTSPSASARSRASMHHRDQPHHRGEHGGGSATTISRERSSVVRGIGAHLTDPV